MIAWRTFGSGMLAICALYLLAAACSGGDDDTEWAPRHGNGTAPEGAHSPSASSSKGTAGSGSGGASGGVGKVDTSNVPSFDPGATSDRPLDSLTDDELEALCERVKSYFLRTVSLDDYERALCYDWEGADSAKTVGECLDAVDSCQTTTSFDYIDCSVTALRGEGESCSATIDDYGACVEEDLAYYKAAVDYWDCKRNPDDPPPQQLSGYPEDCFKLYDKCPAL